MAFDTLEAAQAEIIRLQEVNEQLTTERDTLSENNKTLAEDNDRIKRFNQSLFNRLQAQDEAPEQDDENQMVIACEDFARNLNI